MSRPLLLSLLAALLARPVPAQAGAAAPGLYERVSSESDPAQSYALYLPEHWSPGGRYPALVLADPGGQALVPVERFRAAADRYGWVLLSGWGARANVDTAEIATNRALNAMLGDAQVRWAAERIYLGGFSGTARLLWLAALEGPPWLNGLVVVGAGLPGPGLWRLQLGQIPPFPVYAAAGMEDFNHDDVTFLTEVLAAAGYPHRMEVFEGAHTWLSPALAMDALAWLDLRAVRDGRARRPAAWVDAALAERLAHADHLEQAGQPGAAARLLRSLAADLAGLRDTAPLAARADRLERHPAARREAAAREAAHAAELDFRERLATWIGRSATIPPDRLAADAERQLRLATLRSLARDSSNLNTLRSARRRLALVRATAGFTQPRAAAARGDHLRAAAWLTLARGLGEDAQVCASLARVHARTGDRPAALEAAQCALRHGAPRAGLAADPHLAALREQPGFRELLQEPAPAP